MDEKAAKNGFELVQDDRFNLAAALGKFSFWDCVVKNTVITVMK